ncbi:MAG: iron ABC transporter permease [Fibrobacterota bacterium]
MKKPSPSWVFGLLLVSAVLVFFLYYPVLFILQRGFFQEHRATLALFQLLIANKALMAAMGNSFAIGTGVTLASLALALPLAWFSTRYRLPGQGFLHGLMMLPMILPPFVGAIGMRQFLSRFGTLNILLMKIGVISSPVDWMGSGFLGVVVLEVLHLFPIVYLNLSAALSGIDPALEEAAWNLGSKRTAFFRRILLPLAAPGVFAGCAIVFVWSVTDLGTPLILEYRNVAAYQIFSMLSDINENPMGYALVVFMLAWVALVYFGSRAFFMSRETSMASKAMRGTERPRLPQRLRLAVLALFLGVGFISVIPHLMVVFSAVAERWFMTALPERFTLDFFRTAATHPLAVLSVRNSLFLSSVTTLLDLGLGLCAAYAVARFRFAGRGLLDFSIMLPLALPGLILAFGYVGAYAGTWLDPRQNPFPLLIAAYSVRRLPFMVRSVDAGLRQIHPSMEEAAFNLGASPFRTLTRITGPLLSSSLIAGGILVFSFAMLEVSDSLILAMKEGAYPLTKAIFALSNRVQEGFPVASALGVFAMVLLGASLMAAGKILGKKMGELFRM